VIACNKDGVWNQKGASIALTVEPLLWQRPWFSLAVSLLAMMLVAGVAVLVQRRRHERERARMAALHLLETERTRIAKDIHDDLGATLSAIRLLSKFGQAPEVPESRLREDMRQIATKALESTQSLDEIVWAVDPLADSLESFVNYAGGAPASRRAP
jgi:signal transduction histidine kinase